MSGSFYPAARVAARPWRAVGMLAAVVLAAFVGDRLISLGFEKLLLDSRFRFSRLYADDVPADVLIFGDSRAVNTFYTPEIQRSCGLSAVNLGYNGCSTEIAAVMLDDWLARKAPPKIVVVEVSSALQGNELLKSLKMYEGVSVGIASALADYAPNVSQATRFTHLYRFNSEMFLRALYYLGRDDQTWINGYTIGRALLDQARSQAAMPLPLAPALAANLEAMRRIRDRCREKGIALVLALGPYLPLYRERLTNIDDWRSAVESAVEATVTDFSGAIDDDDCFADNLHMNARGAAALVPAMKQLFAEALEQRSTGR